MVLKKEAAPEAEPGEGLYEEHKAAARLLGINKEAREVLSDSNPAVRLIAVVSGERRALDAAVDRSQEAYVANMRLAREDIDKAHEEANEYLRTFDEYSKTMSEIAEEFEGQHKERTVRLPWPANPSDINTYIKDIDSLELGDDATIDDKARVLAAIDILKPRMPNREGYAGETFVIGDDSRKLQEVGIPREERFPRWELGVDEMADAATVAIEKGWSKMLAIETIFTQSGEGGVSDRVERARKDVYVPISDGMARLLEQAGQDNLDEEFGLTPAWGPGSDFLRYGLLHIEFKTLSTSDIEASADQLTGSS